MKTTVDSVKWISFSQYFANGTLSVFQWDADGVPFPIARVFTISGVPAGDQRANHAHRACAQLLVCLSGSVEITVNDGSAAKHERISADGKGLLIPPLLWNSVTFENPETVLAVFCDEVYDERDYIRDWNEYLALKSP